MTIAACWVRTLENGAEELVFCSDSRLTGGMCFDQGQKIFRFSRTDAAVCFAGPTYWAYPLIIAAVKAAEIHLPSQTRALTLPDFLRHILRILNQMEQGAHHRPQNDKDPGVTFLFGGYDWWKKCFRIWRIQYHVDKAIFAATERKGNKIFGKLGKIEIAGCAEWVTIVERKVKALVFARHGLNMWQPNKAHFDFEPFEVIRDILLTATHLDSVGGAPQAVKVYQFLNSVDVGIFWPDSTHGKIFVSGRPLLEYENAQLKSVLDPQSTFSTWSSGNTDDAQNAVRRMLKKIWSRRLIGILKSRLKAMQPPVLRPAQHRRGRNTRT